jgi:hypothetical protein
MRWVRIRKAKIDPQLRETFEHYGTATMQTMLATNSTMYRHQGNLVTIELYSTSLLPWLTEQYDRAERKETWSLTMESAITVFVAVEAVPRIISFAARLYHRISTLVTG